MNGTGDQHPNSGQFAPIDQQQWGNATFPLGAHYDQNDVNFSVYSRRASRVLLEIYDQATGRDALYDYWLEGTRTERATSRHSPVLAVLTRSNITSYAMINRWSKAQPEPGTR